MSNTKAYIFSKMLEGVGDGFLVLWTFLMVFQLARLIAHPWDLTAWKVVELTLYLGVAIVILFMNRATLRIKAETEALRAKNNKAVTLLETARAYHEMGDQEACMEYLKEFAKLENLPPPQDIEKLL